jgi:protein TonB
LRLTVGVDGSVGEVAVLQSVEPALDGAAIVAVKSWRFRPALRCGRPVESSYTVARRFELGD